MFALLLPFQASARDIGEVSTAFKLIGPNHKIVVTAFEDPKVKGISCYVARPRTGGLKGAVGLAEDPSIASVSCVQTGPVTYAEAISGDEEGEQVFDESRSLIFKSLEIDRILDKENGSLVYVARTTRLIDGSPSTSLSVVAPMTWEAVPAEAPKVR
ncbi:CreA family protein [Aureimonas sp. ME7]|uniref:CreA family protein n=1 Tax=Aureimonas sp. ME7 TaxID=2744252 RepID=UPI001FCE9023|nr:CreA family protein [Aureimonas sp. ME7]